MRTFRQRGLGLLSAFFVVAGLAACSEDPTKPGDKTDGGEVARVLTRVGPGTLDAHPGSVLTLRSLLSQAEFGPIANGAVTWKLSGISDGTALEVNTSTTDENGLAEVTINVGEGGQFNVVATSEGAKSRASWAVRVVPMAKLLTITSTGPEFQLEADNLANVTVTPGRTIRLRVRVTTEDQIAIPKEEVTFAFLDGDAPADATLETTEGEGKALTDGGGEALAFLQTGTELKGYTVRATLAGGSEASFIVTVKDGVENCRSTSQCAPGLVCRGGKCVDRDIIGEKCDPLDDRACPFGWTCHAATGRCVPYGGTCELGCDPASYVCNEDTGECIQDCDKCPDGFTCMNAVSMCVPENPDDPNDIDVTGLWFTRHMFNIRDALPGWVKTLATFTRGINQLFLGQFSGLPSWVGSIVSGVIKQFIPPWVQTIVYLLDSALTIFSELRADGEMDLAPVGSKKLLAGEEYWTSFIFYFLPQCGSNIGGGTNQQPACARVDIYTDELEAADVAVDVRPFTARVGATVGTAGNRTAPVTFDTRRVNMALAGLIKYALDQLIYVSTGYPSLEGPPGKPEEGALYHLVDCPGLGQSSGWDPVLVEGVCRIAVGLAGEALARELRRMSVKMEALDFNGKATASAKASWRPGMATDLGFVDFEKRNPADGEWKGRFVNLVDNVPGRWRASRTPIF